MFELLIRLIKQFLVGFIQLPASLWIDIQWANLRFVETHHLLRLDDYLLKDMGLKKVDGRIVAVDASRIDPTRVFSPPTVAAKSRFAT